MNNKNFGFGTQIRKSPYFDSTVKWGATGFSVYNHMYIPRDFGSPEQNFWNLIEKSILCDVAVERQVEITGPDAFKFTQLLTPRDLSDVAIERFATGLPACVYLISGSAPRFPIIRTLFRPFDIYIFYNTFFHFMLSI